MKLSEWLREECVKAGSSVDDKAMALCEIATLARRSDICRNISEDDILEALQHRETLGSTAFGHGIAIPHCRLNGIDDFVIGLMTVPEGVDFEAQDGQKVHLLVFIIAPVGKRNTHIRLLSALSQTLQNSTAVTRMLDASTNPQLAKAFRQGAGLEIQAFEPTLRNLVHIFVQDEGIFKTILDAVSGLDGVSLSIFDAANAHHYLTQIPIYADFAQPDHPAHCKVIAAMVERPLSNEIIRRVESVTGSLLERSGVMITVQELTWAAGELEM